MKISKLNKLLNLTKRPGFIYCLFAFSFLIVSCEKDFVDTSTPEQFSTPQQVQNKMLDNITGEADVNSVKLNKNVRVLDETANAQMISYTEDKIEFLSHESVNNIQIGDVLNSAPSTLAKHGILVRVLDKEVQNGKIILQVEPGDIDDLFEEADFSFSTQKGLTLKKSGKKDFSYDLDFGGEITKNGTKVSAQIAGKLDFTFDFKVNTPFDPTDNYLRTRMNIHLEKDNNNPDLILTLSKGFEAFVVEDRLLGVVTVLVGAAVIPFSINADASAEIQFDFAVSPGAIGLDLHGDVGYDRTTIGGHVLGAADTDNWNTMDYSFKLDLNWREVASFSAQLIAPKIEIRVTPFKPATEVFEITPLSVFGGAYISGELGFSIARGCLTYSDPVLGFEGGLKGNWKEVEYKVSASKEYDLGNITLDLWCDESATQTYENVGFRSVTDGEYLVFSDNGNSSGSTSDYKSYAHCNRGAFGDWERFNLIKDGDGTFAIQSRVNGKYADVLRSSAGSDYYRIRFDSDDPNRNDCRFIIEDHPDGNGIKAIKSVATDLYLACEGPNEDSNDALYVRPNRTSAGPWERWNIINADL